MPNILDTEEMARKVLPIIYVLDTSGSMSGAKIASVNEAMHETVEVLKEVSNKNPDAQIKIAALQPKISDMFILSIPAAFPPAWACR